MGNLTDISNRLTPSVPIEFTFGSAPIATGAKQTTIFAHLGSSGATVNPYTVYQVQNVGNALAAEAEVAALAGANSQAAQMAYAFVAANQLAGRGNFPAFRIVFLANGDTNFGPSDIALSNAMNYRTDMFVSCYGAGDSANRTKLLNLCISISGPDADLNSQFGSFVTWGSTEPATTQEAYNINSKYGIVASMPDSNVALVTQNGVLTAGSALITALSSTMGINAGASISGTGVPAGALVGAVTSSTVQMVDSDGQELDAAASEASEAIAFQNHVSQSAEIIAAAHAGAMMASAFPYNPLQGVVIGGLVAPQISTDIVRINPTGVSEQMLIAGLSPLTVQSGGAVAFIRTRTTYTMNGLIPVTRYFDWQQLVVMNDFREDIFLVSQNPPFNGNPGGTKASAQQAALFNDELIREAKQYEVLGAFQNVSQLAKYFQTQVATGQGRFDFKVPIDVLDGLYVIAGNVEAVTIGSDGTYDFSV